MFTFEGIYLPLITPFCNGEVDLPAAQRLTRHYVEAGIHGLVVCGTTGEAATLDDSEQLHLLDAVIEAAGDCPVLMGLGSNDTSDALRLLRLFEARPIAGLLAVTPYYTRPSQEGLRAHFTQIARRTVLPLILYNIPYRTGVNLELATAQALCELPNIVAIKQSGDDMNSLMNLICETRLQVLAGEDHLIFSALCLGARGAIAAAAHVRPDLYVALYAAIQAGDLAQARTISWRLLPMLRALFSEPNPAPIKALLAEQGWIVDELRLPMTPVSAQCRERLRCEFARLDG